MAAPVSAPLGVCRDCEQPLRRVDAHRPRSITGIFGDYPWTRPYAVCPHGHGSAAPQDQVLQLGPGQVSPKLAAMLARMAIDVPFDQVPDILAHTLGLALDGAMVRRVTEKVGSWAERQEQQAIQAAQAGDVMAPPVPGPRTLLLSVDGAMVKTQRARDNHRGWHEGKVGVCARFEPTPPSMGPDTDEAQPAYGRAEYCIGFEPQADFLPPLVRSRGTSGFGRPFVSANRPRRRWGPRDLGARRGALTGCGEGLGRNSRLLPCESTYLGSGGCDMAPRCPNPSGMGGGRSPSPSP